MDKHVLDELKKINDLSQIPRLERLKSLHRSREEGESVWNSPATLPLQEGLGESR
jgi:hypothetical protein